MAGFADDERSPDAPIDVLDPLKEYNDFLDEFVTPYSPDARPMAKQLTMLLGPLVHDNYGHQLLYLFVETIHFNHHFVPIIFTHIVENTPVPPSVFNEARISISKILRTLEAYVGHVTGLDLGPYYAEMVMTNAPDPNTRTGFSQESVTRAEKFRTIMLKVEDFEGGNPILLPSERFWVRQMADKIAIHHSEVAQESLLTMEDTIVRELEMMANRYPLCKGPECDEVDFF